METVSFMKSLRNYHPQKYDLIKITHRKVSHVRDEENLLLNKALITSRSKQKAYVDDLTNLRKSLYSSTNEIYIDKLSDQRIFNRFFKIDNVKKEINPLQNSSNTKYASNADLQAQQQQQQQQQPHSRMIKSSNSSNLIPSNTHKRLLQRTKSKVDLPLLDNSHRNLQPNQNLIRKCSAPDRKNRFSNSKIIYLSQSTTDMSKDSKENNANANVDQKRQSTINEDVLMHQAIDEQMFDDNIDHEYLAEVNKKCLEWLHKCTFNHDKEHYNDDIIPPIDTWNEIKLQSN